MRSNLICSGKIITKDLLHQKCQYQDDQNKDRLSVCRILLLLRKLKLGRRLDIADLWECSEVLNFVACCVICTEKYDVSRIACCQRR